MMQVNSQSVHNPYSIQIRTCVSTLTRFRGAVIHNHGDAVLCVQTLSLTYPNTHIIAAYTGGNCKIVSPHLNI